MMIKTELADIINMLVDITDMIQNHPLDCAFTLGSVTARLEAIKKQLDEWDNEKHGC